MVVSSVTPLILARRVEYHFGSTLSFALMAANRQFLFFVAGLGDQRGILLRLGAQMQQQRRIAAVVQNHVGMAAVRPLEDAMRVVPVLGQRLALDREHRRAAGGDRRGRMVLSRIDIAGRPAHLRAQRVQGFDQHRRLNGHVQGAGDARAAQRLLRRELVANRHEPRHFGFGNLDFLAAPVLEREILDDEIGLSLDCCIHYDSTP